MVFAFFLAAKSSNISAGLHYKILRARMMHHNRRGTLLGFEQEAGSQAHADVLFRMEQCEEFGLILEVRARRISKRVTRPAIILIKEITNLGRVFGGDASFFAHLFMMELARPSLG